MSHLKDITGMRFGRLTVIGRAENTPRGQARWWCQCDCGSDPVCIYGSALRNGHTQSCGCLHKEQLSAIRTIHHATGSRLYSIWKNMRRRCNSESCPAYERYGMRGIHICHEWDDFNNFQAWATENGYADDLTIDHINVNGGYSPDNCRWVDLDTQANNTRANHYITIDDRTQTLAQWAREYHQPCGLVRDRIKLLGWEPLRALTTKARPCRRRAREAIS